MFGLALWVGVQAVAGGVDDPPSASFRVAAPADLEGAPVLVRIPWADLPGELASAPRLILEQGPEATEVIWQRDLRGDVLVFQHREADAPPSGPRRAGQERRYRLRFAPSAAPDVDGEQQTWRLHEEDDGRVWVSRGSRRVLAYCHRPQLAKGVAPRWRRSGYVFPLYGPAGNNVLADFPADHFHHRGISWMWPRVFPAVGAAPLDLWTLVGIHSEFEAFEESAQGPVFARIGVRSAWREGEERLVEEKLLLTAVDTSSTAGDGAGAYDFDLRWRALRPGVSLAGQTTGNKGYGGFVVRMAEAQGVALHSPRGNEPRELLHEPFPWTALSGSLNGQPVSLVVMSHPENPGHPSPWLMRFQGYVAESWPGLEPVVVPHERPLCVRFRVLVEPGPPRTEWIQRQYDAYRSPPSVIWEEE